MTGLYAGEALAGAVLKLFGQIEPAADGRILFNPGDYSLKSGFGLLAPSGLLQNLCTQGQPWLSDGIAGDEAINAGECGIESAALPVVIDGGELQRGE